MNPKPLIGQRPQAVSEGQKLQTMMIMHVLNNSLQIKTVSYITDAVQPFWLLG